MFFFNFKKIKVTSISSSKISKNIKNVRLNKLSITFNYKGLKVKFDELKEKPVMLVSASTGYGKSTVVSAFLKNREEDHVWLSLSEKENEFQRFVLYFIKE